MKNIIRQAWNYAGGFYRLIEKILEIAEEKRKEKIRMHQNDEEKKERYGR